MPNPQYNSWRGCALSVAMPQALRFTSVLSTSAQCQMPNAQYFNTVQYKRPMPNVP
ncbi:hypothetical protein [Nostoc sp.]|uniref:hypothetical protein n=1 Tax=Nostoc sp. TaxID=1180 RepID=UPI002FF77B4A